MTAGYIIGFVDAAGMVDPATLPFLMSFYNQASTAVTWHAMKWQDPYCQQQGSVCLRHSFAWSSASCDEVVQPSDCRSNDALVQHSSDDNRGSKLCFPVKQPCCCCFLRYNLLMHHALCHMIHVFIKMATVQ
jgi:hypothetical protein